MLGSILSVDFLVLILGILGAFLVGLNYILEATNRLGEDHKVFSWINLISCVLLFINAFYNKAWVFVGLNTFLMLVGVFGLYNVYFKKVKLEKKDF